MDELERREALRKNRRRPIEETLAVIGEGRSECLLSMPIVRWARWTHLFLETNVHPQTLNHLDMLSDERNASRQSMV